MTTVITILALAALLLALVRYGRHDRFAGPGNITDQHDELGSLALRDRIVPLSS